MSINDYEIVQEIGSGAMGVVYLARDPRLDRYVAIKKIKIPDDIDKELYEQILHRFYREARAVANLKHPNVIVIYELGENSNINECYMVMEYLEGESLDVMMAKRTFLPVNLVIKTAIQACEALHYIHTKGIIHRDIKPGNLFLCDDGMLKIMDFGLVRTENSVDLTNPGALLGSILYMPLEQLQDAKKVDHRVDIYSLGVTLYHVLSSEFPYYGYSFPDVVEKIQEGNPMPLSMANPTISKDLEKIIMKAVSRDKDNRYYDMLEFQEALINYNRQKVQTVISPLYARITKPLPKLEEVMESKKKQDQNITMKANKKFLDIANNNTKTVKTNNDFKSGKTQFLSLADNPYKNTDNKKEENITNFEINKTQQPIINKLDPIENINIENIRNIVKKITLFYKNSHSKSESIYNELNETINKYNSSLNLKNKMYPQNYNSMMDQLKKKIDLLNSKKERVYQDVNFLKEKTKIYHEILKLMSEHKEIIDFLNNEIKSQNEKNNFDKTKSVFRLSKTQTNDFKSIIKNKINLLYLLKKYQEKPELIIETLNKIDLKIDPDSNLPLGYILKFSSKEKAAKIELFEDLQKDSIIEVDIDKEQTLFIKCESIIFNGKAINKAGKGTKVIIKSLNFTPELKGQIPPDTKVYSLNKRIVKKELITSEIESLNKLDKYFEDIEKQINSTIKINIQLLTNLFSKDNFSDSEFNQKTKQQALAKTNNVKLIVKDLKDDFKSKNLLNKEDVKEHIKMLDNLFNILNKFPVFLMNYSKSQK